MNTMVLLTMPLALHYVDVSTNSLNDCKNHVASHFDHLELTNVMLVLMMSSVSCDTNNGIT